MEQNEKKAREIANDYPMPPSQITKSDVRAMMENSALQMAEWKDQQFKEYLEDRLDNAKKHFVVSRGDVYYQGMWEMLEEIINEFFGE